MRIAPAITLSAEERTVLEFQARSRSLPVRVAERARIVLFAASGQQDKEIAARMAITPKKVSRWRQRFLALGVAGLEKDAPRPGRKRKIGARLTKRVVTLTTRQQPANATHWSTRTMAAAAGISEASVRRIWRAHGLKPHRVETFKISNDPAFAEKLEDIVGLYLNPPEHALVLCADEKSQIQALDRTQPGLPLKRGRGATMTHDYKRHGTATLFAALHAANGEVFGLCQERHRHQEWLKFLRLIDQTIPADRQLHLICDNYATHKHPKVQRWLRDFLPYPQDRRRLPTVLSREEVSRLINAAGTLFRRTLLMTLYGTGMRRSELAHLKVGDIDSQRMIIRVVAGKGGKDRDLPLSPGLLETLRE